MVEAAVFAATKGMLAKGKTEAVLDGTQVANRSIANLKVCGIPFGRKCTGIMKEHMFAGNPDKANAEVPMTVP
jgi:hypothetical protein